MSDKQLWDTSTIGFLQPTTVSGEPDSGSYRFFVVTHFIYIFSLVGHASFVVLFFLLSADLLAFYNIFSSVVFAACIAINKRGHHLAAFYIAAVEVVFHSSLCAFLIGWPTGFHYFIVGIVPFSMLLPGARHTRKVVFAAVVLVVYGIVYFFSSTFTPRYVIGSSVVAALNYANLVINFGAFSVLVHYLFKASILAEEKVGELSRTDFLTGLLNRRGMLEQMEAESATFRRTGRPFSILLGDLDDFKVVNDRYGHGCGDAVLVSSAELLRRSLRGQDVVCRWGGEEFLIVLPETDADGARCVAENLLQRFRNHRILCGAVRVGVTITMGGACCCMDASIEQIIVCADRALYLGKGQGKDRVVLCRDDSKCAGPGAAPPVQTE